MPRLAVIALLAVAVAATACGPRSGPPAPISHGGDSRPALSRSEAASGVVVVQPGDTLYAVARRTGSPVRALIDTNRLQAPYRLRAGQRLQIPTIAAAPAAPSSSATGSAANAPAPIVAAVPRGSVDSAPIAPPPPSGGTPVAAAPAAQPVAPATPLPTVLPGGIVMPPPPAPGTEAAAASPSAPSAAATQPQPQPSAPTASQSQPPATSAVTPPSPAVVPNASPPGASAAVTPSPPLDTAPPARAGRFLWPVRGNVISSFGAKPGGLQNDGINIAAPRGTPVRAAENGVVVYAGNELKGFGNLLLVRHADGWMSAYAHLDEMLVERGASVTRGQQVAKVGQSGSVASPQLHFELRRAGRAVDPRSLLAPVQTADAN